MKIVSSRLWTGLVLTAMLAPAAMAQFDREFANDGGVAYGAVASVQQQLNANDVEWAVLQPRLQHVVDTRDIVLSAAGNAGRLGFQAAPQNAVTNAIADLQTALDNGGTPLQINVRIKAFRDALTKAKADNKAAQEELRKILTVRQEGIMIASGYLE